MKFKFVLNGEIEMAGWVGLFTQSKMKAGHAQCSKKIKYIQGLEDMCTLKLHL